MSTNVPSGETAVLDAEAIPSEAAAPPDAGEERGDLALEAPGAAPPWAEAASVLTGDDEAP